MNIYNINQLKKLKKKQGGNVKLCKEIDLLLRDLREADWDTPEEMIKDRPDADKVHSDGFYFFDINIHRTMILIQFEENHATIVWTGSHDEYLKTFKNNKSTIEKWLRNRDYI